MSQASNHIIWCINKAKKELKETQKHRGIIKTEPDIERAKKHLEKAEHNFNAILYFQDGGYSDWSASAAFYTLYHCFLAILAKYGYESRNQECTISMIQYLKEQKKIILEDKFIEALQYADSSQDTIIELRENFQYGVKREIHEDTIKGLLDMSKELIHLTKDEMYRENQ
jgi:uncharacterized protein (UPF0332 family)